MAVQIDTSGRVVCPPNAAHCAPAWCWSDLTPFAQGYVKALFADFVPSIRHTVCAGDFGAPDDYSAMPSFRHLAPATLARIMADCEWQAAVYTDRKPDALDGQIFWDGRKNNVLRSRGFPPLTPYLGDDGLIYFKEAA